MKGIRGFQLAVILREDPRGNKTFLWIRRVMSRIIIRDSKDGVLNVDLIDVLNAIGPRVCESEWILRNVEAIGDAADIMHDVSDSGLPVSGARLVAIASNLVQVVEGIFYGILRDQQWIIIRAIDSSEFEVETDEISIIETIRDRFHNVDLCDSPPKTTGWQ